MPFTERNSCFVSLARLIPFLQFKLDFSNCLASLSSTGNLNIAANNRILQPLHLLRLIAVQRFII